MEAVLVGAVLRFLQALLQATPTILVGVVVAGIFRRLLGHAGTRRLFGENTRRSLLQAWLIGMLLPVCSLGVIPVVRELRRAGVSGGTILAFALTAPLFNPISVLYGLTLSEPVVIITFCFCSLLIVTVVGLAWDRMFPGTAAAEPEPPAVAYGIKRMLAVAVTAAEELAGPAAVYILIGLAGVSLLSIALPNGCLQQAAEHDDAWAPLFMTAVAIPAYATPMTAMVQLASMFQHGNSVGAAFALLALGAGANVGLVVWMATSYGARRTAAWFGILVAVVVGLAYGVDKPLYPHGVEPAGHTHAFDGYCCPFHAEETRALSLAAQLLREKTASHERQALVMVALLTMLGLVLKRSRRAAGVEAWLQRQPAPAASRYDVVLPAPVLGGIGLAAVVALSVFGCYVYYPPPEEIFEELRIVNTEVVASATSRDWDTAAYWIPVHKDWIRKVQVSMFLRGIDVTRYRRAKADLVLERLELLEHEIEGRRAEPAAQAGRALHQSYRRLRAAYGSVAP